MGEINVIAYVRGAEVVSGVAVKERGAMIVKYDVM